MAIFNYKEANQGKEGINNAWRFQMLYRPTVEPILLSCMATIAVASLTFQPFLFESICQRWLSETSFQFRQDNNSFRVHNDSIFDLSLSNRSSREKLTPIEFCRTGIKRTEFGAQHKLISAATSKVSFYGYS